MYIYLTMLQGIHKIIPCAGHMVSTHILSIGKKQDEENHVRMVCYYLPE